MTLYLERPKCTCFTDKEYKGRGETATDIVAADVYNAVRHSINANQICPQAVLFALVKAFTFTVDCVCYNICTEDETKSNPMREKFFAELPEKAKQLVKELDDEVANSARGGRLQ